MTSNRYLESARKWLPIGNLLTGLFLLAGGCAVEAGNPDDDDDASTGTVKLSIASDAVLEGIGLYLNLSSVEIAGYEDSMEVYREIEPATDSINLLEMSNDGLLALTDASEVPVGIYDAVSVVLKEDRPVTYVNADNEEADIDLASASARVIRLEESFEVLAGENLDIVIRFDPGFSKGSDDRFIVRPKAGLLRKPKGGTYAGTVEREEASLVCAYAYLPTPPPPPRGSGLPPPPPRGGREALKALPPPLFDTAESVTKDEDASCVSAVARSRVAADRSFLFRNLIPATYDFRVFYDDGTFEDLETGVLPLPPPPPPRGDGLPPPKGASPPAPLHREHHKDKYE